MVILGQAAKKSPGAKLLIIVNILGRFRDLFSNTLGVTVNCYILLFQGP